MRRVLIAHGLAALALGGSASARADIWGFVDETGAAHVAADRLDDRYQLFFKGGKAAETPEPAALAGRESRAAFERTLAFQHVRDHRNAERFSPLIDRYAKSQQLDPALVKAVIAVESAFEPDAVSTKGAVGLMQVIRETGERYGVAGDATRTVEQKLRDPSVNLRVGTRYLHDLLALFANDLELALAAYNAGEKAVVRYDNTIPPFAETQEYVKLVRQFHSFYSPAPATPERARTVVPGRRSARVLPGEAAP